MAPKAERSREHLGRTGAGTPPPSAPWVLSRTATETLSQPAGGATLSGTSKMSSTISASTNSMRQVKNLRHPRLLDRRPSQVVSSSIVGNSSSSSALPESWRQTWSDAGAFPSPTLRRAESDMMSPEKGLSTPAHRANYKAEKKMRQYAELTSSRGGGAHSEATFNRSSGSSSTLAISLDTADLANHKERAEAFKANAMAVDDLICNLSSSLSGGIKDSKARELERLAAAREGERRRIAKEEREARLKEAAARDPHKKVQLKLENTRKFGKAFLEELCVPMQQVDFVGDAGVEQVNMVDVQSIRQKCKKMDGGATPSVESLIEDQTRSDRLHGVDAKTGKVKGASTVDLNSSSRKGLVILEEGQVEAVTDAPSTPQGSQIANQMKARATAVQIVIEPSRRDPLITLTEEKRAKIASRKAVAHFDSVQNRVDRMRSSPTNATLIQLGCLENQTQRRVAAEKMWAKHERSAMTSAHELHEDPLTRSVSLRRTSLDEGTSRSLRLNQKNAPGSDQQPKIGYSKTMPNLRKPVDPKMQKRVTDLWNTFRYAAYSVVLWRVALKKRLAMDRMKSFCLTLGEWTRIRKSMYDLKSNVKALQRACRYFLAAKKKRCDMMSKEWHRVEDHYLSIHFTAMADKVIEDERMKEVEKKNGPEGSIKHQRAKTKMHKNSSDNEITKLMKDQLDWKMYRLPAEERRGTISRYYMVQLKKKIRQRKNLLDVVHVVVSMHHETLGFLKQFGADESQAHDLKSIATGASQVNLKQRCHPEFWHLSEDRTLDLIAFTAHKVKNDRQGEHWHNHPANVEITGMPNPMYRSKVKACSGKGNDFLSMMGDEKPGSKRDQEMRRRNTVTRIQPETEEKKATGIVDLDELWRNFTPRLREEANTPLSRMTEHPMSRPDSRPGLG